MPWWGVPVVAGAFLLVGGFLTYLYTRSAETRKASREEQQRRADEVLETGLAMLTAGAQIRNFGLLTLRRAPSQSLLLLAQIGRGRIDAFVAASQRFSITMPAGFQRDFQDYVAATSMLVIPPFQRPGQELMLGKQSKHERELVRLMRAMRGQEQLRYDKDADYSEMRPESMLAEALHQDAAAEARSRAAATPPNGTPAETATDKPPAPSRRRLAIRVRSAVGHRLTRAFAALNRASRRKR